MTPDFDGYVVSLGALGVITHVTLDIEPTYDVRQDLYTDLPWDAAVEHLDEITASAYSVSLFTDWLSGSVQQVWLKSRGDRPARRALRRRAGDRDAAHAGGRRHRGRHPPGRGQPARGTSGCRTSAWSSRRAAARSCRASTSSRAPEAPAAIERLRELAPSYAALLQVAEIRTVAADSLWLSGAYDRDVVGFHFTWVRDVPGVYAVLPAIEDALLPLGRPAALGQVLRRGDRTRCGRSTHASTTSVVSSAGWTRTASSATPSSGARLPRLPRWHCTRRAPAITRRRTARST